jgi:Inner membrane component of T3SS, cytoplasmic domain
MSIYLGVRSGIHRGAKIRLPRTGGCIGRTLACDVVLADASIESRHCGLTADEKGIHITAFAGNVVAHGQPLAIGETFSTLDRKTDVVIGGVSLLLVNSRVPKPASSEPSGKLKITESRPRTNAKYLRRVVTVAGFCTAAVASYKTLQGGGAMLVPWMASPSVAMQAPLANSITEIAQHPVDRFQATLELSGFLSHHPEWRGVKLRHTAQDSIELVGVVETRESLDRLQREGVVPSARVLRALPLQTICNETPKISPATAR